MAEGQNQAGQAGAGQESAKNSSSIDAVVAGAREAAKQLSERQ